MRVEIKVNEGYEVEDVLEKALKTIRAEQEGVLRDPYLLELYKYSNTIYNAVMNAMNEEILEVLYGMKKSIPSKPLGKLLVKNIPTELYKAKPGLYLKVVPMRNKNGVHMVKRWVSMDSMKSNFNSTLAEQGMTKEEVVLTHKRNGNALRFDDVLEIYKRKKPQIELGTWIRHLYKIDKEYSKRWKTVRDAHMEINKTLQSMGVHGIKNIQFRNRNNNDTVNKVNFMATVKDNTRNLIDVINEDYDILDSNRNIRETFIPYTGPLDYNDYPIKIKRDWTNSTFANNGIYQSHYNKHAKEFAGGISKGGYLKAGVNLLNTTQDINVIEVEVRGNIMKYDKVNNLFVSAKNGKIRTIMKPHNKEAYFENQIRDKLGTWRK